MRPLYLAALPLSLITLACGCRRQQAVSAVSSRNAGVAKPSATESFPHIRAVTPESVPFTDNKAIIGVLHVTYEIDAPELLTNARLELRTDTLLIERLDVPIQSNGEADLHVNNDVRIGPTVRLQLQCPNGETNWLAIGALRPAPSSASPRIENITPDHVPEESDLEATNGGVDAPVRFLLGGAGFQRDCKGRFTVNNGPPIDAQAIFWGPRQTYLDITRRPLEGPGWSNQRYLDLRLVTERRAPDWTPKHHSYLDVKADIRPIPILDQ